METQVIVKREGEQVVVEVNAATLTFIEDAMQRLHIELIEDHQIQDFRGNACLKKSELMPEFN